MKKPLQKRRSYRFTRWAAVCVASAMLMLYGITGRAAQTGTVNNDNVNVRTQASAESDRVCKLPKDTELAIVDQTTGSDGNVWYSVTFTFEGEEKSGWIRSDMVTVSETEEPVGGEEGSASPTSTGSYSIQEPAETYPASDILSQTGLQIGEDIFTAWVVDAGVTGGRELYLVWASDEGGNQGWFYYDPQDRTFQREMGQFSGGGAGEPEGMIQSLQDELGRLKEESAASLSQRLYVIIGLSVLSVILLIIVIVLAIKLRGTEYEYYDEDEEDDENEDEYEDYEEPKKKRGGLFRRRVQEEEDDDDDEKSDFDDLLIAVKKKWAEEEEREAYGESYEDEEDFDEEPEDYEEPMEEEPLEEEELPEIDMSAVLEVEKEAAKESVPFEEEEDMDDFDIEILDLDDLDL